MSSRKPCSWAGCPELISDGSYCPRHAPRAESLRAELMAANDRMYRATPWGKESKTFLSSKDWQNLRREKLRAHPFCAECERNGILGTLARDVHHIAPRATRPDLALVMANLESLCTPCHSAITRRENRREKNIMRYVITGPTCSGKTRYVEARRQVGDAVWDYDAIAATMFRCPTYPRPPHAMEIMKYIMAAFLNAIASSDCTAYIIVTDEAEAKAVADRLGASVIHLTATPAEIVERQKARAITRENKTCHS